MSVNSLRINQTAHGFSDYDAVGFNSGTGNYVKALDHSTNRVEPLGLAVDCATDKFTLLIPGRYRRLAHGLTVGNHYVSSTTPGSLTTTKPGYPAHGNVLVLAIDANWFHIFNTYGITSL